MSGEISRRLDEIKGQLNEDKLAEEGFKFFRGITPIRSGNARRNTFRNKDSIQADYPYARRLDEGYSPQARKGMTQPTIDYIKRLIKDTSKG
jgi:hypothetical protein